MSDIQPTEVEREEARAAAWKVAQSIYKGFGFSNTRHPVDIIIEHDACIRAGAVKAEREKHAVVFRIAANAIYFDDSSDYQSALYEIIEALKPGYAPDQMPFCETVDDALAILSDDQEDHRG